MRWLYELDYLAPAPLVRGATGARGVEKGRRGSAVLPPPRTLDLERGLDFESSRTARTLQRLDMELAKSEFRGSVSRGGRSTEQLESFADRLIRENVAKQASAVIVAGHVRRTQRILDEIEKENVRRPKFTKRYDTAFVSSRKQMTPRTVFGTDAWMRSGYDMRKKFINKVLALPCVERSVRKEVMFARGKAGHGHRVKHRPGKFSDIWC